MPPSQTNITEPFRAHFSCAAIRSCVMGYFKRPIRRGPARQARLAYLEPARKVCVADWKPCDLSGRSGSVRFLRFAIDHPGRGRIGLFRSTEVLEEDCDFTPVVHSQLRSILKWFNKNLPAPRRLPENAVCWFRSDAADSLRKIRDLVELYRQADRFVWMHATRNPGRVVYRDAYQVAAVPYRDRRMTAQVV
jgi:hypothetical protein